MTNEDVKNCNKREMPQDVWEFVKNNYTKVDNNAQGNWNWEQGHVEDNDWKYGRFKIDTERMAYRGLTAEEFYKGAFFY